jgi:hypothetical protein
MARKYNRDNRGRFASGGGGATARGGRLKTASGKKRETQKMSTGAVTSVPGGTIAKGGNSVRGSVARSMANTFKGSSRSTRVKPPEAPKATAAQRKKALIRDASQKVLAGRGKEVGTARRNYIRAQQEESLRMEKTGKGSKAARRMAKK